MSSVEYERFGELADREAAGEALTGDEREFLARFAAEDSLAAAEVAFFDALADLDDRSDEVGARRLADASVKAVVAGRAKEKARRARGLAATGTLAVAAAAALWFSARPSTDEAGVAADASVKAVVETGTVAVAGIIVQANGRIEKGAEIEARGGAACVALEPTIHVCLGSGSRVKLSALGTADRRVDLLSGRVAAALSPLPAGQHFSVVAGAASSTAIGTAFTVELRADGSVETVVHEGKVKVGTGDTFEVVPSHRIGLVRAGEVSTDRVENHGVRVEAEEWTALAKVAGRSVEAPLEAEPPPSVETAEPAPAAEAAPSAVRSTTGGRAERRPAEPPAEAVDSKPATPGSLLVEARQALREQRWADAASSYRKLVSAFPGTAEASTALVPLAGLEIDRLGQPGVALTRLDAYLAAGGPLVMEARLSRIRAYRALGRTTDEVRAIDEFLSAHPNALDVAKLRERRDALRGR